VFDSSGRFVLWTDLGSDRVVVDRYDSIAGTLTPSESSGVQVTPGSGPRHLAWHPSGRVAYLLSELTATVTQLKFDPATGALTIGQTIGARAAGATGDNTAAEIAVSPDGRFLYTSNRGDDNLAVFAIDGPSADLKLVTHVPTGGRTPRHFAIDSSGRWLIVANQNSDSLTVFRIDPNTGIPARTDATITIASPVNVVFTRRK
jgi:6-phosphogluconolactonase